MIRIAGVMDDAISILIADGEVSSGLALRIGSPREPLQEFVNGVASGSIARVLGTTVEGAQLLRDELGRDGAVGLLLGLAHERNSSQVRE